MIYANTSELKDLENKLKILAIRSYPFATKNALNKAANSAMQKAKKRVSNNMILKNAYTKQSIRFNPARTLRVSQQYSTVGSIADYMVEQEFGGVTKRRGKNKTVLPTSVAAGQDQGVRPRTKVAKIRLGAIKLKKRKPPTAKNKRRQAYISALMAVKSGRDYVYLDTGKSKGIFQVKGDGKRLTDLKMIYSFREKPSVIPPSPWLKPSFDATIPEIPKFYRDALSFQLRRLKNIR